VINGSFSSMLCAIKDAVERVAMVLGQVFKPQDMIQLNREDFDPVLTELPHEIWI
jgi:hypothetical protein